MNSQATDFTLQALEARFEMQYYQQDIIGDGSGPGSDYGYSGSSWGNYGSGNGYVGTYQTASDGSGAMLDDGTYTDGTSGSFPSYPDEYICLADPNFHGCQPQKSFCTICRC